MTLVVGGLRAEWCKLRTTAVPWVLGAVALVVTGLGILGAFLDASTRTEAGTTLGSTLPTTTQQLRDLAGAGIGAALFALLLGVLCVTTEFRHKTVTTSFLVTPRRPRFVAIKLLTVALAGVALAVVLLVITVIAGGLALSAQGGSFSDLLHQVPAVAPGMVLVFALYGILGAGIGSLLTNQVAAIIVSLGWFVIIEPIIESLVHSAERWLPSGAAAATASVAAPRQAGDVIHLFPWWEGALLMLAYGLLIAGIGSLVLTERDIT